MRSWFCVVSLILIALFISCSPKLEENGVVSINGTVITADEFFMDIEKARFVKLDSSDRASVIGELVKRKVILTEAEKRGIPGSLGIPSSVDFYVNSLTVDAILEEEVWDSLMEEPQLKLLYKRLGREVGVRHIVITYKDAIRSRKERSEEVALAIAWEIKRKIERGELEFSEAARQYSEDPSALQFGKLGYFRWGQLFEPVQSDAFSLNLREISDPVRSAFGYHLVYIYGMRVVELPPYEEYIPQLKQFIRSKKGPEFNQGLKRFEKRLNRKYRIVFNEVLILEMYQAIVKLNSGNEDVPRSEQIMNIDTKGIVCTIDGEPLDVEWFKSAIKRSGPLARSLVLKESDLKTNLKHAVFRHLTIQYALKSKDSTWHLNIKRWANRQYILVIRNKLLQQLENERVEPGIDTEELIDDLVSNYSILINDKFLTSYGGGVN